MRKTYEAWIDEQEQCITFGDLEKHPMATLAWRAQTSRKITTPYRGGYARRSSSGSPHQDGMGTVCSYGGRHTVPKGLRSFLLSRWQRRVPELRSYRIKGEWCINGASKIRPLPPPYPSRSDGLLEPLWRVLLQVLSFQMITADGSNRCKSFDFLQLTTVFRNFLPSSGGY